MNKVNTPFYERKFWKWYNPAGRQAGGWGFILNRITGLGLTLYLYLHLVMLGQLAQGEGAYDGFLELVHNPIFLFGEVLVVAAGFIHGLNGIRIVLTSLGVGVTRQKAMLYGCMSVAGLASLYFAFRMFGA